MIKKFTFLLFAAAALAVGANADDNLTFNWAHSVDGSTTGGDNGVGMAKASDGSGYYALTTWGSSDAQGKMNVNVDGDTLYTHDGSSPVVGGHHYSTSMNANILLQKVDSVTGAIKWYAYSKRGEVNWSNSSVKPTSDGGLLLVLKCRAWAEEDGLDNLLELVDAKGHSTTINDQNTTQSEYRYLIIKMSGEGVLEWSRVIAGRVVLAGEKIDESYSAALKQNAKDVIDVYGADVDGDDNIYLAGHFRTSIYFKKKDGSVVTFTAKNNQSYTGDSQEVMGDLFLVKLDKDGYYENSLLAEGTASLAFFDNVVYNDGKVYLNGRTTSDGTTLTLGGKEITASSSLQTEFLVSVNTADMSVNWVSSLVSVANTAKKFVVQNKNAQYINGSVYFTGLLNGGWAKQDTPTTAFASSNSTNLKGYVLKVSPETGEIENSYVRTDGGIGGFFGAYVAENNTYLHGYDMASGALLTKISNDTYTKVEDTTICKYGTTAVASPSIVDGENFIMMNRGGKGNNYTNSATFYNTDKTFTNLACWGTVYYSYKINDAAATEEQ